VIGSLFNEEEKHDITVAGWYYRFLALWGQAVSEIRWRSFSKSTNGQRMSDNLRVYFVRIIWERCRICVAENLAVLSIRDVCLRKVVCRSLLVSLDIASIPGRSPFAREEKI